MLICHRGVGENCGSVRSAVRCAGRQVTPTTKSSRGRGASTSQLFCQQDAAFIIDWGRGPPTLCHPTSQLESREEVNNLEGGAWRGWRSAGASGKIFRSLSDWEEDELKKVKALLFKPSVLFIFCCRCLTRHCGENTCE